MTFPAKWIIGLALGLSSNSTLKKSPLHRCGISLNIIWDICLVINTVNLCTINGLSPFKRMKIQILLFLFVFQVTGSFATPSTIDPRPRIIITADPELDDNNSLIRFLLYSSEFRVEGLVYASSQFHWKGDGKGTKFMVPGREYTRYGLNLCPCTSYRWREDERFIHDAVNAYEKVYPNLIVHDRSYPAPAALRNKIRYGNIEFEGDFSKETEGSELIRAAIMDEVPGPLFITAWGGMSTIARALRSIEERYAKTPEWDAVQKKVSSKVVLLPSGDQDGTYESYIKPRWPGIDYRQYRNGPNYGYGAQLVATAANAPLLTAAWMTEHITGKGPLGALYRVWGDGRQMVKEDRFDYFGMSGYTSEQLKQMGYIVWMPVQEKGSWLGEGDTGTFMNILSNGLEAWEQDTPGGWAGRPFHPDPKTYVDPFSNDTTRKDLVISETTLRAMDRQAATPFPDFFPAAQLDFAARMKWSVTGRFADANHAPVVKTKGASVLRASPGATLKLTASVKDPDGDALELKWWQFLRPGQSAVLEFGSPGAATTSVHIPSGTPVGQTFEVVLEVKDQRDISMSRYQLIRIKL